ncbi:FAD/NAD(P)-binding protein [Telmatocola sphagniphila]|uniref:FAD/NAD(P)-binding protein n=1 Tax=Telmatocola sphagniphila TaxID=1123043 RepID=A0A8E6B4X3_9BACT|nr:FAD/NAD(P)-binding protein [Telmatocola sphagniphila]QVL31359.1 FAD/NAD(P)-binding protein [Telmatocola sphagniphila]
MRTLRGPLLDLVQKLDELAPEPTLVELVRTLEAFELTSDDVIDFVQKTQQNYSRVPVVLREHYELLVMTWLPGQASIPHDHTNSICVVRVIQGEAVEASYGIGADGYADLEYETPIEAGQVVGGHDAGVHSIRNASQNGQLLVTVHIYAPRLKEFRRFEPRPNTHKSPLKLYRNLTPTITIVGGGFSGSMAAAQILRRAEMAGEPVNVELVERRGTIGEGLAYSTRESIHLLNVPAARMSAWPDKPDDFLHWAQRRHPGVTGKDFLPRQWYGEYVRESLLTTAEEAGAHAKLDVILDEVRRLARHPQGGWMVHLGRGTSFRTDAVILAIGHRPPSDPIGKSWSGPRARYLLDPWRPFATNDVGVRDQVVILGTGLTAVDTALSLAEHHPQSTITMISRRGLLPLSHATSAVSPARLDELVEDSIARDSGLQARRFCRELRQLAKSRMANGGDWRSVVDGLRPHTAKVWQALSPIERRRFLSHLRPFWEVHRHRMASAVAEKFQQMLTSGQLKIISGKIESGQADDKLVHLSIRERATQQIRLIQAAWVLNCTGPMPSNSAEANPVMGSLLVEGCLRTDALALGIETTPSGNLIDINGEAVPEIFVVGTLRKPALWESTAVPELRMQAADAAERVWGEIKQANRLAL